MSRSKKKKVAEAAAKAAAEKAAAEKAAAVAKAAKSKPKAKKKGGLKRKLLLLVVGTGVALATSEGLRNKVLDALFGAEEEFEYTSSTAPVTAAPEPTAAS